MTVSKRVYRNDGAYQLNIKLSGSLQNPAFSQDGKSIVFTRFHSGYNEGKSDLFIYNLESSELRLLISDNWNNINLPGASWNNSINSIVFSSDREPHDEIFLIADTGTTGKEVQLTHRRDKQSYEPTLSPDGKWVVFESHDIDVEGHGIITKYQVNGKSKYINLTAPKDDCRQPNWSPEGSKILYQKKKRKKKKWAIWTMDIDGHNKKMITSPKQSNTDAVFSTDGKWIIYSSENNDVEMANIYKVISDGGKAIQITIFSGYDGAPSISPDDANIVFESSDREPDESEGTTIWMIPIL